MKISRLWIVFLGAFIFYILFANAIPITDSVESNYALTAKEMALSSDWISPRIYGKAWYDKPIMIYWLLATVFKIFGFSDLAARIVPALFGATGVAFIYWFVKKIGNERLGLLAAGILGTSFQYFVISKLIITDMILFDLNAASLVFFYFGYAAMNRTKKWYLAMYVCLGLAVLTKGPVGILLPGLIILLFLTWQRQWIELKKMRIGTGLLLFALSALPWYVIMVVKHGSQFINSFLGVHNYLRATVSEHPRDNVFYYYVLVFILSSLPWTGVMVGGLWDAVKKARVDRGLTGLMLIWAGVFFIFYSCMATKYLTYTFPMMFPIAVLAAFYVETRCESPKQVHWWIVLLPLALLTLLFGAAGYKFLPGLQFVVYLACLGLLFIGILWCFCRRKAAHFTWGFLGVILVYLLFTTIVLPVFAQTKSGKNLAGQFSPYRDYQIGAYRFYSTSAVYYSGNLLNKIESRQNINHYRNKSFSWYVKYTMPVYTVVEFQALPGKKKMIIVPKTMQTEFFKESQGMRLKKLDQKGDNIYFSIL